MRTNQSFALKTHRCPPALLVSNTRYRVEIQHIELVANYGYAI